TSEDGSHAVTPKPAPNRGIAHAAEANQPDRKAPLPTATIGATPLVVIPEGRINAIDRQEVPAQHDGQLLFVGTELSKEEASKLPQDLVIKARIATLWVQLAQGDKERLHLSDADVQRFRIDVSPRGDRDLEAQASTSATEDRDFRRLRDDEDVPIGSGGFDASKIQIWREDRFFRRLQEGDAVT